MPNVYENVTKKKMNEPYLALFVSNGVLHLEKKLPTEETSREIVNIPLSDVMSDSFDDAGGKLGATMLGILRIWHKKEFEGWGNSDTSRSLEISDFSVALYLISRLSGGVSEDRLRLIDDIIAEAATSDQEAAEYVRESWPALRKRLLRG